MTLDRALLELGIDPDTEKLPDVEDVELQHQKSRFDAFDALLSQQGWTRQQLGEQPTETVAVLLKSSGQDVREIGYLAGYIREYVAVSGLSAAR